MKNKFLEEILIALSLANLLFIFSWRRLIYPPMDAYHIESASSYLDYLSVFLNVIALAGVFLAGLWIARRFNNGKTPKFAHWIFIAAVAVALNAVRIQFYPSFFSSISVLKIAIFVFFFLLSLFLFIKFQPQIFKAAKTLILILAPFVLITFSQDIFNIVNAAGNEPPQILSPQNSVDSNLSNDLNRRVVWIIFDELDYVLSFENRPANLDLPEFDRLKSESFFAVNATPPAPETLRSMPSLITGKKVEKAVTSGKRELLLDFNGQGEPQKFSEMPNVFSEVRKMNGGTAIVGWYHPYCRVIGKDLNECQAEGYSIFNDFETGDSAGSKKNSLFYYSAKNLKSSLFALPFGLRLFYAIAGTTSEKQVAQRYVARHQRMIKATLNTVANPSVNLCLIHLPIPHLPSFYNRVSGQFDGRGNYTDNLKLADNTLGEIRRTMEKNGSWDDSILIVSSDHSLRLSWKDELTQEEINLKKDAYDPRIPFFVKLPKQRKSFIYEKPFNTVLTKDLILNLIKGEISNSEQLESWMNNRK